MTNKGLQFTAEDHILDIKMEASALKDLCVNLKKI